MRGYPPNPLWFALASYKLARARFATVDKFAILIWHFGIQKQLFVRNKV